MSCVASWTRLRGFHLQVNSPSRSPLRSSRAGAIGQHHQSPRIKDDRPGNGHVLQHRPLFFEDFSLKVIVLGMGRRFLQLEIQGHRVGRFTGQSQPAGKCVGEQGERCGGSFNLCLNILRASVLRAPRLIRPIAHLSSLVLNDDLSGAEGF